MPQSEFDIIESYFNQQQIKRDDVILGIGDDAAILVSPSDKQLVIAIDTLISGVHFPANASAEDIGYKALAVNLSDLAAMGAEPAWFTLALSMPESNSEWLAGFAKGLFSMAGQYQMQLIGGDTTRGPLTVSVQVAGYVPPGKGLRRAGAKSGDNIYVTGTLGDAALGLRCLQQPERLLENQQAIAKLNRPRPRVDVGRAIRDIATACIDISDGLLADLGHVLEQSRLGASVDRQLIPMSEPLHALCEADENNYRLALSGGDDYELCFCAPVNKAQAIKLLSDNLSIPISCIGVIEPQPGLRIHHAGQDCIMSTEPGYEHFK